MDNIFNEMEKRIDNYFNNISDEQLEKDIHQSGYSFFKKIKTRVFSVDYSLSCLDSFFSQRKPIKSVNIGINEIIKFKEYTCPSDYYFEYKLAA